VDYKLFKPSTPYFFRISCARHPILLCLGDFLFRFGLNRCFIAAGQQAFVIELADLPFQGSGTPMLLDRFLLTPASGVEIIHPE
jgi:hypothetical protein